MDNSSKGSINVHGATLSRRQFVKTGGALFVGIGLLGRNMLESVADAAETTTKSHSLDASLSSSWFEIHADNTIVMRTGKVDFGQSTAHTAYKQILAEELSVPFDAITEVVMGSTISETTSPATNIELNSRASLLAANKGNQPRLSASHCATGTIFGPRKLKAHRP